MRNLGEKNSVRSWFEGGICRIYQRESGGFFEKNIDLKCWMFKRERNPGYPIPKRGIYYCSRMLSRQLTNAKDEDYGNLKPVYSVWIIVNNIPKILQYSRHELMISGINSRMEESQNFSEKKKEEFDAAVSQLNRQADLIHLCLVFLSEDFADLGESGDALIRYLQSVFIRKAGDPEYNPYALYSKSIEKELPV